VTAQEAERSRIAADIHDDPVQLMTAIEIRLEGLKGRVGSPELVEYVGSLQEAISASIGRLRALMFELRPPVLQSEGLAQTLRASLEAAAADFVDAYELLDGLSTEPPVETRVIAYRIAQEALANIRKHAQANQVRVELESRDHGLRVCIEDDGVGFSPAVAHESRPGHLGLTIMRERAELAGGWLEVHSSPGGGTSVEFWLPPEGALEFFSPG
jgi:signal transduction histidine kinase